jgi:hypothetical protein
MASVAGDGRAGPWIRCRFGHGADHGQRKQRTGQPWVACEPPCCHAGGGGQLQPCRQGGGFARRIACRAAELSHGRLEGGRGAVGRNRALGLKGPGWRPTASCSATPRPMSNARWHAGATGRAEARTRVQPAGSRHRNHPVCIAPTFCFRQLTPVSCRVYRRHGRRAQLDRHDGGGDVRDVSRTEHRRPLGRGGSRHTRLPPGARVLDLACATGIAARLAAPVVAAAAGSSRPTSPRACSMWRAARRRRPVLRRSSGSAPMRWCPKHDPRNGNRDVADLQTNQRLGMIRRLIAALRHCRGGRIRALSVGGRRDPLQVPRELQQRFSRRNE